jgi:hypothetical protein
VRLPGYLFSFAVQGMSGLCIAGAAGTRYFEPDDVIF